MATLLIGFEWAGRAIVRSEPYQQRGPALHILKPVTVGHFPGVVLAEIDDAVATSRWRYRPAHHY